MYLSNTTNKYCNTQTTTEADTKTQTQTLSVEQNKKIRNTFKLLPLFRVTVLKLCSIREGLQNKSEKFLPE